MTTTSPSVLTVSNVRKQYGATIAVDDISFEVKRGEIVGLLGPNGAGKTTTISMILSVLAPSSGKIEIEGIDIAKKRAQALSKANFAAVYAPLPGNITVYQNLHIFGLIYGVPSLKARIQTLLEDFNLKQFANTRCGVLSSGEQTRVSLAKALLNKPQLLLLDEPTSSLDPATARDLRTHIKNFAETGESGVLWTSHNMMEVETMCDRVLFLARGRILLEGNPKTLPREHGKETLEDLFIAVAREPLSLEQK